MLIRGGIVLEDPIAYEASLVDIDVSQSAQHARLSSNGGFLINPGTLYKKVASPEQMRSQADAPAVQGGPCHV